MKDKYKEWLIDYCDKHVTHPDRCEAFEAGAQSRQDEIDELRSLCESIIKDGLEKTDRLRSIINQNNKEIEELQKRIDVLITKFNEMAHTFLDGLEEILKGETNE